MRVNFCRMNTTSFHTERVFSGTHYITCKCIEIHSQAVLTDLFSPPKPDTKRFTFCPPTYLKVMFLFEIV